MRIGVVGVGRISSKHIDAIRKEPRLQLVGLCDKDIIKLRNASLKHNVSCYKDMLEMINETKPDIVSILTDSGSHAELALLVAEQKCHAIVEKPLALLLSDADDMISAFENSKKRLFVVKQNRYNPPIIKLRKAIEKNALGDLFLCNITVRWCRDESYYEESEWRGTWAKDGGVLSNQAIHYLDMMLWLMGDVSEVCSFKKTCGSNIEVDDTNVSVIKFESGALGLIEATTAARPKNIEGSISVLGTKGVVKIGGHAMNAIERWEVSDTTILDEEKSPSTYAKSQDVYGNGHDAYYKSVVDSLISGKKFELDGNAGRKSLALVYHLYRSSELNQLVTVDDESTQILLGLK